MIEDRLGVITDEVSPSDLIEALNFAVLNGLKHVEIRTINGQNVLSLHDQQLAIIRSETERRGLFVSCIASPIFKCALGTGSKVAEGDRFNQEERTVSEHFTMLERAMDIADQLGTDRIRIFSFWREAEPEQHHDEIVMHLTQAALLAASRGKLLLLENEPSCNGGYAAEVAKLVGAVNSPALRVLWDPGNEQYGSRTSYPEGYSSVCNLMAHVHLKDVRFDESGQPKATPIGSGIVPYEAHFQALLRDGYTGLFTLETHYIPEGGTAMEGTAQSLQGLKALLANMRAPMDTIHKPSK
ncbi:sugar phosphate isomerase/epimerase [Paenibacillus sp. CF384]|uniref:sugar phosphate isomerase/epimerase family protein n=1 Tax=Paenibacillus sp. CF384 TaxID=1884382 RepID=UPI00089ADFC2|nr:sugar phosphate isomerase/epimerase family protein [Paenibacillus sp. CF384]SDW16533.1 Sugar phosphate isomerase/epimerase [Paenibacillus sp. CF384]